MKCAVCGRGPIENLPGDQISCISRGFVHKTCGDKWSDRKKDDRPAAERWKLDQAVESVEDFADNPTTSDAQIAVTLSHVCRWLMSIEERLAILEGTGPK